MNIKLIADSACDIEPKIAEELGITILPVSVNSNGNTYRDNVDIFAEDIYKRMRAGEIFKTSQITLNAYDEIFKKCAAQNIPVLCLTMSSGISGTYKTCISAADMIKEESPYFKISVVDSKAATFGYALILYRLAEKLKTDVTLEEITEFANNLVDSVRHVFTVGEMEFLYRGGRISRTASVIGSALNIKPMLIIDKDGYLKVKDRARGEKKLLLSVLKYIESETNGKDISGQTVFLNCGDDDSFLNTLKETITEKYGVTKFVTGKVGPTIVAHTGPTFTGVFFLSENI